MCLEYRNLAAHGGRIYNYEPINNLKLPAELYNIIPTAKEQYRNSNIHQGFTQLLFALSLFNYKNPYEEINKTFNHEINRHCNIFMEDASFLQKITGVRITKKHIVYVTKDTKKYHINPHCSGMENPICFSYEKAISEGYLPCKRCIR